MARAEHIMVRVVFVAAPFKRRMIERMADEFRTVEYEIVTPSYPSTSRPSSRSVSEKARMMVFGDAVLRSVVESRPDLVYTDNALYSAELALLSLRSGKNIPQVVHLRGDWWREYWAWFAEASWRRRLLGTQQFFYNWLALIHARKVTPICQWLEKVVNHHIPPKRTEVVYQGVDPEEFYPEKGLDFDRPAVAIVQNHTILPKVEGLLNFRRVVKRLPKINFYITEGEAVNQRFLPMVKDAYSHVPNAHFVSNVTNLPMVRQMLTACDCYVLASGLDCCPTTVLEASLMERPVIASRIGGVPEIIRDNETGWSIENARVEEWMDKITLAVTDNSLSRKFGKEGREWVSRKFGWKAISTQVEKIVLSEASTK